MSLKGKPGKDGEPGQPGRDVSNSYISNLTPYKLFFWYGEDLSVIIFLFSWRAYLVGLE